MSTRLTTTKRIKTVREYSNDTIFHGSVYALECEDDNFYVGYTLYPKTRLKEHFDGGGSKWTKQYAPKNILNFIDGDIVVEDLVTLIYMRDFGIDNVRGGHWCHTDYAIPAPVLGGIKNKIVQIGDITVEDVRKDYSLCNLIV